MKSQYKNKYIIDKHELFLAMLNRLPKLASLYIEEKNMIGRVVIEEHEHYWEP